MKSCAYTSDLGRAAIRLAGVCVLAVPSAHIIAQSRPQGALQIVERSIGGEVRYRGDTIWRERDTTMTRTVFRGDTLERTTLPTSMRPTPTSIALSERMFLEQALRSQAMDERMASSFSYQRPDAPSLPATTQSYAFSANRVIELHVDTVRYINGCAAAPPVDTTIYLLFGDDSLLRVSPAPRTFGRMMPAAVRADIRNVLTRRSLAASAPDFSALPGPSKWPCDR